MPDERPSRADKITGPLAPRRAIAVAIKDLREQSGKSLNEVADDLLIYLVAVIFAFYLFTRAYR